MRFAFVASATFLGISLLAGAACAELSGFIKARGDQLFDGDKPFQFISFNIPNLQLIEDNFAPDAETAWRWPNEFELNDALASVRQLGGTVVRTYVLSARREGSDMGDHVYVRGPGKFNEEAFQSLDRALEAANRQGVRLIIPLVDNWKWQGGIAEYAAFRGLPPEAFWTNEQLIADFEATIRHVLTRVNSRTGVAYRDDPAILGWETGNELDAPPEWTARIAKFIKSLDRHHLVIDGYALHGVREESLADPNIDVVTTHHYPNVGNGDYIPPIRAARAKARGRKPYFVGEFGFIPTDQIAAVYDEVIANGTSGALLWSLRFHNRDGGYYWHSEPCGEGLYKAYHWPGSSTGDAYNEREVLRLTRTKAFEIRGDQIPPLEAPEAPVLLPIVDVAAISWRGGAGAATYAVERATNAAGPWTRISAGVDDAAVQYRPLFSDASALPGQSYFYRVIAKGSGGESQPSNVVGPVAVKQYTLVDEARDLALIAEVDGEVVPVSAEARRRREDCSRLKLAPGSRVTYRVDAPINSWQAEFFLLGADATATQVAAEWSVDGVDFKPLEAAAELRGAGPTDADYGYLPRLELSAAQLPAGARFLRLAAETEVELAWLEIRYGTRAESAIGPAQTPAVKKHDSR
ncbi:cellulase family glycosylhydrolase [Lacipirellula sp.]|uniref:cellulase family glycosylhydrolase n=1 Tax=Lacipirellula sp. TaxID=2691419 RepID=UPI003D12CED4